MGKMFFKNGTVLYKVGNELMPNTPLNVIENFGQLKKYRNIHKSQTMCWNGLKSHIIEEIQVFFIKNIYFKMKFCGWYLYHP